MRVSGPRLRLLTVLAVAAVPSGASAQPGPPRFTAGIELARLDVEVTDAQGRPIRDLRADEVEVIEGGVRRPVALLQHVREPAGSYADAARRTIGGDVSTNQGAPRGRLYVFVFDQSHITPRNEQVARRAAERFLRTRVRPGDRVALYGLPGPGARVGFTGDVGRAIAALPNLVGTRDPMTFTGIGAMREFEAYEIGRGNQEILQQVLQRLARDRGPASGFAALDVRDAARSVVSRADFQARQFLDTFADLIRGLRLVEGRKDVILVSEGFYDDNVGRDLERVAAAAAQSHSAVYALDINRSEPDIRAFAPRGGQQFTAIQSRVSPLGTLAAETDGELFAQAARRLDAVLERIGGRSRDYYLVGFEPAADEDRDPQEYRRVTVRVARPGARVSTRTGYAVGRDDVAARGRRQAIDAALAAPFALQGLRVDYTTYVLRGETPGLASVVLSLETELPVAAARARSAAADVVFVVRDARTGRVVASGTDIIALPAVPSPGRPAGRGSYRVRFEAPPGVYLMRAVVREPGGQVGSADRQFEVPSLSGPAVSAGDLVLGPPAERFRVRATVFTDDGLSGTVALFGPPAEIETADVELTLVSPGDRNPVTRIRTGALDLADSGSGGGRMARLELPLDGLAAGRYVARVDVTRDGETVHRVRRELDIVVGSRPGVAPDPVRAVPPSEILRGQLATRYLTALDAATGDGRVATALARARQDDWPGVDALTAAPHEASGPKAAVELALRGLARFAGRDHAGATEALEAAFAADTDADRRALTGFFLGWAYTYQDDDRQAASAWRRAVFLDPQLVPAHLALADAYVRLSQPALAAQVLRAGLTTLPDSPELRERLSRLAR